MSARSPAPWRRLLLTALLGLAASAVAAAPPPAKGIHPDAPLTFGILPIGGPAESLRAWAPLLQDMQRALDRPVNSISVSTYEGIAQAIGEQRVDVAFLSGRLALNAVSRQGMRVVAQMTRIDGTRGYHAVLIVRRDGPIDDLEDVMAHPDQWRLARGESLSVSGYLVPEAQLFAPRGLDSDTFFKSVRVDNHENNALAVANGEVDVATNNTADLSLFRKRFPGPYQRLQVIWRSILIPHAVLVVRTDLPHALQDRIAAFLTHYGRASGAEGERERSNLKGIHGIESFAAADNATLIPFADIDYRLEKRRAMTAQWVSDAAKRRRLQKVEARHKAMLEMLDGSGSTSPAPAPAH